MSLHDLAVARSASAGIAPPTKVKDLVPGLLLFFARPSYLQSWAEMFGHEWRHVGITVQTDDGLRVASYGPRTCFRLDDPVDLMPSYNRVGVARVFDDPSEIRALEQFCRGFEHLERSDSPYLWAGVAFGPLHLTARRMRPGLMRSLLFAIVFLYCWSQELRYRDRSAYACSTFVWDAIHAVRKDRIRIPLSAHPDDEAAYATPSNRRDELYARWLVGPTELWHSISEANRAEIDLHDLEGELVIDLTTSGTVAGDDHEEVGSSAEHPTLDVTDSTLAAALLPAGGDGSRVAN